MGVEGYDSTHHNEKRESQKSVGLLVKFWVDFELEGFESFAHCFQDFLDFHFADFYHFSKQS